MGYARHEAQVETVVSSRRRRPSVALRTRTVELAVDVVTEPGGGEKK